MRGEGKTGGGFDIDGFGEAGSVDAITSAAAGDALGEAANSVGGDGARATAAAAMATAGEDDVAAAALRARVLVPALLVLRDVPVAAAAVAATAADAGGIFGTGPAGKGASTTAGGFVLGSLKSSFSCSKK